MAGYEAVGACLEAPNRNPAVVDFVVDTSERHGFRAAMAVQSPATVLSPYPRGSAEATLEVNLNDRHALRRTDGATYGYHRQFTRRRLSTELHGLRRRTKALLLERDQS